MTDTDIAALIERLRGYVENIRGKDEPPENYLCWQAADEIEKLRAWKKSLLECIDRTEVDARNMALEEAAKVAHEWDGEIAAAIRALKAQP